MRNHLIANPCLISLVLFFSQNVKAENDPNLNELDSSSDSSSNWYTDLEFGATFASDSLFRGQSGTDSKPGATIHAFGLAGPFYTGALWFNKYIAPEDPTTAEADFIVGVMPTLGRFEFDFAAFYCHLIPDNTADYWEYKAGVGTELFYGVNAALNYYHSPNYINADIEENVYELTWKKNINEKWNISGSTGHVSFSENMF